MMKRILVGLLFLSISAQAQLLTLNTPSGNFQGFLSDVGSNAIILIIPGSGGVDHNGNAPGSTGNYLLYLSDSLNAHGISTLRTDKMNAEKSEITIDPAEVRISHFIELANAWVDVAVDSGFTEIYVLGHSQGSLIALVLGRDNSNVSGVISLCGAGERIHEILKYQMSTQFPEDMMPPIETAFDSLAAGHLPKAPNPMLQSFFSPAMAPFLKSWTDYDPCEVISDINKPILILGGSTDIQVTVQQAERLKECNDQAKMAIIQDMGHMLKKAPGVRMLALQYYGRADLPLHPDLTPVLVEFLK